MVERYLELFPYEREHVAPFREFVGLFDGGELIDRRNFTGHLTASAMIYDAVAERFLLLKHHSLGMWLQPGGHVESSDVSLLASACREVAEETGLGRGEYEVACFDDDGFAVFEIDSHPIPSNERKGEEAHFHHDVRFLFLVGSRSEVVISRQESDAAAWYAIDELPDGFNRDIIARKLSLVK